MEGYSDVRDTAPFTFGHLDSVQVRTSELARYIVWCCRGQACVEEPFAPQASEQEQEPGTKGTDP